MVVHHWNHHWSLSLSQSQSEGLWRTICTAYDTLYLQTLDLVKGKRWKECVNREGQNKCDRKGQIMNYNGGWQTNDWVASERWFSFFFKKAAVDSKGSLAYKLYGEIHIRNSAEMCHKACKWTALTKWIESDQSQRTNKQSRILIDCKKISQWLNQSFVFMLVKEKTNKKKRSFTHWKDE